MTCNDFKRYLFNAPTDSMGDRNLLQDAFAALPSQTNVDFMGVTQALNSGAKNMKKLNVKGLFDKAIGNLRKKIDLLYSIQMGLRETIREVEVPSNER
ncbi:uncharacterized protein ColSpa_10984 [Colletotrichum spaethianum]|uniref:Uncharacterized protein n=1 Tax=Colletotrichum spaethianum TaxID=700344 RepID=A0AA37PEM9_9PEZI|nr:uncharacterized protein ColSpa_10984 [Colletotrichum spaethianum]GKT50803.1 hypothetical protein ColSpa_10984 [Colletotrichum spaethianum]